jgi:hypothetical protein
MKRLSLPSISLIECWTLHTANSVSAVLTFKAVSSKRKHISQTSQPQVFRPFLKEDEALCESAALCKQTTASSYFLATFFIPSLLYLPSSRRDTTPSTKKRKIID